jgi:hypothetical protein
MTLIKLGYTPTDKNLWTELPKDYNKPEYNGKLIVEINVLIWEKVKHIIFIRKKGYDAILLIDGKRRTGKSTVAKQIAYLLDPDMTMNNYVADIEEAPDKIENAKDESVLIFDEGSLVASSKDSIKKQNSQLLKIIDVVGQKKLCIIFCMPSFFRISREIVKEHSLFLIHIYTDQQLNRGRFIFFGTKKMNTLYSVGKKNFGSYKIPKADFNGRFVDFKLPFDDEYLKLKRKSLMSALHGDKKVKPSDKKAIIREMIAKFHENCPELKDSVIIKGFGVNRVTLYRSKKEFNKEKKDSKQ